jgi:uncharacterized FlaG/YvyC family protein
MDKEIKLLIEKVKKIHKHNLNEHFSFDQSYFIKIINELYPNLSKEDIKNNREEIIDKVISTGKLKQRTSSPSIDELENWKKDINELLELFEKNGEFKTDRDYEKEKEDIIRKYNMEILNDTSALKQEFIELPEYLLKEVGFDNIIKFIKTEDDISYIVVGRDFTKFDKYDDDIQNILNKPENKASWDEISAKLRHYYGKRAYWNIPTDKKFDSPKNAENFIKTYTQKFIYEYLLPRAKNYHKLVK